jgi:hypothetical protein
MHRRRELSDNGMQRPAQRAAAGPLSSPRFATPDRLERAVNARDARAILGLYAPDVHVVWPAY